MSAQVTRDIDVHHQDSIRKLIGGNSAWAGWSNTDVDAYIANVSKRTGYGPDDKITSDQATVANLMAAMTKQENSRSNYTPRVIVEILNNTGANVNVTAAQLPQ